MVRIDEEFKVLIPPLTQEEYSALEQSILSEGCRDAIVTWNDIIVDGHNRYEICTRHNVPFKTVAYNFKDRDEAKVWMIQNQLARRNLHPFQRVELTHQYDAITKAEAQERNEATRFGGGGNISTTRGKSRDILGSMAGMSGKTYEHAVKVMELADEATKEKLRRGETTINKEYRAIRLEEKKAELAEKIAESANEPKPSGIVDIYNTDKRYRVIYADPPWSYSQKMDTPNLGGAVKHYPTMPLEDICALPIPAEKDAVLFLWVTSPMLEEAFEVIHAWGFTYKSSFIWDKVAHALGFYNSVRHEFLLICTRGNCTPDASTRLDSVVSIERTEHSVKPNEFREIIDTLYPIGNRLELFARRPAEGWDVWGNEV